MERRQAVQAWSRVVIVAIALAIAFGSAAHTAWAQPKVRFAQVSFDFYWWPQWVAEEQGYFREEGIIFQPILINSPAKATQALSAGSVEIAPPTPDAAILAQLKGAPVRIIAGIAQKPMYELIASPRYRSMRDLKGTTIGVINLRAGSTLILQKMLEAVGLKHQRDYDLLEVGTTSERFAAVKSGGVAAAVVTVPTSFRAEEEGLVILGRALEYLPDYQFNVHVVNTAWARREPEQPVKFLRATLRGLRWLHDSGNREAAARLMNRRNKVEVRYALRTYDLVFRQFDVLPVDARVNRKGLEAVISLMVERKAVPRAYPPEEFMDDAYRQRALATLR